MTVTLLGSTPTLLGALRGNEFDAAIDEFLLVHPKPSSSEIAEFLKVDDPQEKGLLASGLLARGVDPKAVSAAMNWLEASARVRANWPTIAGILSIASASASAYHGYKRNASVGWAIVWFGLGSIFPVITPVVALAQGYGKPKKAS